MDEIGQVALVANSDADNEYDDKVSSDQVSKIKRILILHI
jgi:hypothetical protein